MKIKSEDAETDQLPVIDALFVVLSCCCCTTLMVPPVIKGKSHELSSFNDTIHNNHTETIKISFLISFSFLFILLQYPCLLSNQNIIINVYV